MSLREVLEKAARQQELDDQQQINPFEVSELVRQKLMDITGDWMVFNALGKVPYNSLMVIYTLILQAEQKGE